MAADLNSKVRPSIVLAIPIIKDTIQGAVQSGLFYGVSFSRDVPVPNSIMSTSYGSGLVVTKVFTANIASESPIHIVVSVINGVVIDWNQTGLPADRRITTQTPQIVVEASASWGKVLVASLQNDSTTMELTGKLGDWEPRGLSGNKLVARWMAEFLAQTREFVAVRNR
jgi:hypothetical protein